MPSDSPPGAESPLDAAISERDQGVLDMVSRAIETRNVRLAYQPVMQAKRPGKVAFWEGLLRVLDTEGRIVPARDFIGVAETREMGRKLDCLALEAGLDTLAAEPDVRLSINMSARSIGYPPWTRILERGLERGPTIGERLILEITESSAMVIPDIVSNFMAGLQKHGVAFALDDFGSGFTAFRYFRDFYFDLVKIDGQFIRGIARDPDNQCLASALIGIARHFDMFAVAESVERREDAAFLVQAGIDCMQGYLYGAPTLTPLWAEPARQTA